VRFLVDQNLSARVAELLGELDHDAVHTSSLGLEVADDEAVLARARDDDRVLISADSDFGMILAATRAQRPSVLYIRRSQGRRVEQVVQLIADSLEIVEEALHDGSLVVLGDGSVRIRQLPVL
jgi:predicted nuclease of predicted toxin-antitoxin system